MLRRPWHYEGLAAHVAPQQGRCSGQELAFALSLFRLRCCVP